MTTSNPLAPHTRAELASDLRHLAGVKSDSFSRLAALAADVIDASVKEDMATDAEIERLENALRDRAWANAYQIEIERLREKADKRSDALHKVRSALAALWRETVASGNSEAGVRKDVLEALGVQSDETPAAQPTPCAHDWRHDRPRDVMWCFRCYAERPVDKTS